MMPVYILHLSPVLIIELDLFDAGLEISHEYDNINNLPHHVSAERPHMPMLDRAARERRDPQQIKRAGSALPSPQVPPV